jgi:hypothetical protein
VSDNEPRTPDERAPRHDPADTRQPSRARLLLSQSDLSVRFTIRDYLEEYVFPEELVSYRLVIPQERIREARLHLTNDDTGEELPCQIADTRRSNGYLTRATVRFRTSLGKGEERHFTLRVESRAAAREASGVGLTDVDPASHTAVLASDRLSLRVPYGDFDPKTTLSGVPAPVLAIKRRGAWIGHGWFHGALAVERVRTHIVEDGPLLLRYAVRYELEREKVYEAVVTVQKGEHYATVDEYLTNIDPLDRLSFLFSYKDGIDPDGRLVMGDHGKYLQRSGRYDRDVADFLLPYALSVFGHNMQCPRCTIFYRDDDEDSDAILFSLYRLRDFETHLRHIWTSVNAPENFYFHCDDTEDHRCDARPGGRREGGDSYVSMRLMGRERHWAVGLVPRRDVSIESQDGSRRAYWYANNRMDGYDAKMRGGDPAVRVFQKLQGFSLDWVKDLTLDWDEVDDAVYQDYTVPMPFELFDGRHPETGHRDRDETWRGHGDWDGRWVSVEKYQEGMCYGAKCPGRDHWRMLVRYAASRGDWTMEQRRKVRAWFVHFVSNYMFLDDNVPHYSMLGGHPNSLIESLHPGVFAAVFPNHPYVKRFARIYKDVLGQFLDIYVREADTARNALPGRAVENVACYSQASLRGILHNLLGFEQQPVEDIRWVDDRLCGWLRWHMYALVTADREATWTPPQGAHARERAGKSEFGDLLLSFGRFLARQAERVGDELVWCLTKGAEGSPPTLESAVFRDYGAILRHDFGGEHEAYLNLQQLGHSGPIPGWRLPTQDVPTNGLNYRWGLQEGEHANGAVYYAANGTTWSWNDVEVAGDKFDCTRLPLFRVGDELLPFARFRSVLYDFEFAQFVRTPPGDGRYRSRWVMMVRDEFVAIYDEVEDDYVEGTFQWVNETEGASFPLPAIHAAKTGPGHQLHIVEPREQAALEVEATEYGARAGDTLVFVSATDIHYETDDVTFDGRCGFAGPDELALFEGTCLRCGALAIDVDGDFGASVRLYDDGSVGGRVAGRSGGMLRLALPASCAVTGASAVLTYRRGEEVRVRPTVGLDNSLQFEIGVSQSDGYVEFSIAPSDDD